jgi:predicted ATPase
VDWSYQLLTGPEQRVFRRLAVFPGPFTLDAAEAVAGADAGPAVLRLVDCSLLVPPRTGPDGRSRYLMLETLRSYGLTRLRGAGEEDAAVHQGLAWALDHDPLAALRLAVALTPWWLIRGRWVQGSGLLQRAVNQTGPDASIWYSALLWLGQLVYVTLDYDSAQDHYGTVVAALKDSPPSPALVEGLLGRCAVLRNLTSLEDASADAHAALDLAREIGYATGEAIALAELSLIACYADDSGQAVDWARQAQRVIDDDIPGWAFRKVKPILPWGTCRARRMPFMR